MSYLFGRVENGCLRLIPHRGAPDLALTETDCSAPGVSDTLKQLVVDGHFYTRLIIGVPVRSSSPRTRAWESALMKAGYSRVSTEEIARLVREFGIAIGRLGDPEHHDVWGFGVLAERPVGEPLIVHTDEGAFVVFES